MKTQTLLVITAILEILTGMGLILVPGLLIRILLGADINDPVVFTITRVGGSAILALGFACWQARNEPSGRGLRALVAGMLVYNIAVFITLANSALQFKTTLVLIAALIAHAFLTFFCFSSLKKGSIAAK